MEFADAVSIVASRMSFDDKIKFAMIDVERVAAHVFKGSSVESMLKRMVDSPYTTQLALARLIIGGVFGKPKPCDSAGSAVAVLLRNSMRQASMGSPFIGLMAATELWLMCGSTNIGHANPFMPFLREQLTPGADPSPHSPLGQWLRAFVGPAANARHLFAVVCGREILDANVLQDESGAPRTFAALMLIESIGCYAVDGFPVGDNDSVRRPPVRSCCASLGQLARIFDVRDLSETGFDWALSRGFSEEAAGMIKKRIEWRLVSIFGRFVLSIPMKEMASLSGNYLP